MIPAGAANHANSAQCVLGKHTDGHTNRLVGGEEIIKAQDNEPVHTQGHHKKNDGGDGDSDKWDFGDDSDEQEEQVAVVGKERAKVEQPNVPEPGVVAPAQTTDNGGRSNILEDPEERVVIDRLGRRENVPKR